MYGELQWGSSDCGEILIGEVWVGLSATSCSERFRVSMDSTAPTPLQPRMPPILAKSDPEGVKDSVTSARGQST